MTSDFAVVDRLDITWTGATALVTRDPDRLDRLCARLVDHHLPEALEDAGVRTDGEVCLRRVAVPVHTVRWYDQDDTILAGWGRTIAGAVTDAARSGVRDDVVVRYPSRLHAIIDAAVSAYRGDRARAWAWLQLGLWRDASGPADTAGWLVDQLVVAPRGVVAALAALAGAGHLGAFVGRAGPDAVAALVRAAWVEAGGEPSALRSRSAGPTDRFERDRAAAATIVARSQVAQAMAATAGVIAERSTDASGDSATVAPNAGAGGARGETPVPRGAEPEDPGSGPWADLVAIHLAAVATLEAEPSVTAEPGAGAVLEAVVRTVSEAGGTVSERGEPRPATPSRTEWAGLLFLLGLVADIELPARVHDDPVLSRLGLRATLHRLSGELVRRAAPGAQPPADDDPGRLAFAGLGPQAEPPRPLVPGATGSTGAVAAEVDHLVAALRAWLVGDDLARADDSRLLLAVCRRSAAIDADPAWLDVSLDLDQVSVAVRRARLDLDPGYLPWLGCVVRFRYA